jgi:hypothetical protein
MHTLGHGEVRWAAPFPRAGGALARHYQRNQRCVPSGKQFRAPGLIV